MENQWAEGRTVGAVIAVILVRNDVKKTNFNSQALL